MADETPVTVRHVWTSFPTSLRWLLVSDVFIRTCDALVDVFLVLYAINVFVTFTLSQLGMSAHHLDATMVTGRVHRMTELFGRLAPGVTLEQARAELRTAYGAMTKQHPEAYSLKGDSQIEARLLREQITSRARSVLLVLLIVDFAAPTLRGRVVGLYYLCRSLAIAPAAFIGGLLWRVSPSLPFFAAGAIRLAGVVAFVLTVEE